VSNYLEGLNAPQREAVINTEGPSLVIAGAGSGKTKVLTYRIAHLLRNGKKPWEILALTFTNKAAREMKDRIATEVGQQTASMLWMGTFHSIFAKILRKEAEAIGYPTSFTIYDTSDSKNLVKTIIKEMILDDQVYKAGDVFGRISAAKNNLITAASYQTNTQLQEVDRQNKRPEIAAIYKAYVQRCFKAGAMDFDDLLLNTNVLFRDHPAILEKYQEKFQYILVDEYQDTNFSQYLIIKKLAMQHKNVCVVGDDAQSIYSFRGAKIENILNFRNDYPEYKLFKLEQNYRSTQTIVNAANSIIAKNKNQIQKKVFSENETGNKIKVTRAMTDAEEGYLITNAIMDSRFRDHYPYSDYAILYRTNAQSRIFEESLRKRNIPYRLYGGVSFYQREEIKNLLAYFRLIVNHNDDVSFKRIINTPKRGIGDTTVEKLEAAAGQFDVSIWELITHLNKYPLGLNQGTVVKINSFVKLIESFIAKLNLVDAFTLASEVATMSGILQELYKDKAPESVSKYENVQELLNAIKEFTEQKDIEPTELTLDKFLEDVALMTNEDKDQNGETDKVTLMTIHASKGLEFRNVYIVGVEEKLFPSEMSSMSADELEEERRLFYVAVTRAKENLSLSYATSRFKWGNITNSVASRFIREIDESFVDLPFEEPEESDEDDIFETEKTQFFSKPVFLKMPQKMQQSQKQKINTNFRKQEQPFGQSNQKLVKIHAPQEILTAHTIEMDINSGLRVGLKVEHQRFGIGQVTNLEGIAGEVKATIEFETCGIKQILVKFAKLKILAN